MSDLFLKQLCFMYMYVFFCIQVVLDISTKTCGPCKIIYPKLVKMSKEYSDALFLRINGDLNSDTRVRLLPCTPQKRKQNSYHHPLRLYQSPFILWYTLLQYGYMKYLPSYQSPLLSYG